MAMQTVGAPALQMAQILSAFMRPDQLGAGNPMLGQLPCSCQKPDQFNASPDLQAPGAIGSIPNFGNFGGAVPPTASPAGQLGQGGPVGQGGPAGQGAPVGQAGQATQSAGSGGGGAAARAVDLAKRFEGMDSKSVKGKLPGFTAPGGNTNNCAAFVSACLEHTGALPKGGGSASVSSLRSKLKSAGWKKIPPSQAQKGAVWMTKEGKGSHTELVASAGAKQTVGSNNVRKGFQKISTRNKNPESGECYAPPNG